MKKLMIAAAAAAMVGGVFADYNETYSWNKDAEKNKTALFKGVEIDTTTKITTNAFEAVTNVIHSNVIHLDKLQVVTLKRRAYSNKFFCLNDQKNEIDTFYKPSAASSEKFQTRDGAIYHNGEVWVAISWGKDGCLSAFWAANGSGRYQWCVYSQVTEEDYRNGWLVRNELYKNAIDSCPLGFYCYADKGGKKVWGALQSTMGFDAWYFSYSDKIWTYDSLGELFAVNARTPVYGEIDIDNEIAKNVKNVGTNHSIALKTYKDKKSTTKAVANLLKKFIKAGGEIAFCEATKK